MIRALEPLGLMLAGIVAIWTALIPFDAADDGWPGPDLVLALTLAWVVRRPAGAPFWAVAALGMAADLALARPVGLGALALLLAAEVLRPRAALLRAGWFVAEWAAVAALGAATLVAMNLALAAAFLDPLPLGLLARQAATTALAYPVAAAALALAARPAGRPS